MSIITAGAATFSTTTLHPYPHHKLYKNPSRADAYFHPLQTHHHKLFITTLKQKPISRSSVTAWTPESWQSKPALQLPEYPDKNEVESVLKILESYPPIVFAGECRKLEERLGEAARGDAFLLQGGDCAESFKEFKTDNIRDTFRLLLQMSVVLMFGGQMPVIKGMEFV
ncbi:phospho-2-dehydro-3-deoxyheptonate aldolase 2, chloroplastic-like protein [Tanacetum coccineum]